MSETPSIHPRDVLARDLWDTAEAAIKAEAIATRQRNEKFSWETVRDRLVPVFQAKLKGWQAPAKKRIPFQSGAVPARRERDPFFDAISEAFGLNGNITISLGGLIGKVKTEVKAADPTLTPGELKTICQEVRKKYQGATVRAVALHFHEFAASAKRTATAIKHDPETEPPAWEHAARKAYPATWETVVAIEWGRLPIDMRRELLRFL